MAESDDPFNPLPAPLQRAADAKDLALKPFSGTISSLDVSSSVVDGNLTELLTAIEVFTGDSTKAVALWREPPPVKHRYQLRIVRLFHNFLSSAIAHLDHLERASAFFKKFAPELFVEFRKRHDVVTGHLRLLVDLRDFSTHKGAHQSALTLRFTDEGQVYGEVGFSLAPVLAELEVKAKAARSTREKLALKNSAERLRIAGAAVVAMSPIVGESHREILAHRKWSRRELVELNGRLRSDLVSWASTAEDRQAIVQFYIDNPIPVYKGSQ